MLKIVLIAIVCSLLITYLKYNGNEMVLPAIVASSVIILSFAIPYLSQSIAFVKEIYELTGLDDSMLKIVLKITGIAYLVEIANGLIDEMGLKSMSDKLALVGRLVIISVSMPIFVSLFNLIKGFLQ